jgi:hypothetical protein
MQSHSICSMEVTGGGGELVVGGGGGAGEVPGSTNSWVEEVRKEVTTGAAPDNGARFM